MAEYHHKFPSFKKKKFKLYKTDLFFNKRRRRKILHLRDIVTEAGLVLMSSVRQPDPCFL